MALADFQHPPPPTFPFTPMSAFFGTDTPTTTPNRPYATYLKTSTGGQYYWDGSIWHLISGGGSGAIQVLVGAFANPNGNSTPDDPSKGAIYYQEGSVANVWRWSISGVAWIQTIGV